eukprot:Polyplicarium_translucidae@DN2796_c0_g1_i2.p1
MHNPVARRRKGRGGEDEPPQPRRGSLRRPSLAPDGHVEAFVRKISEVPVRPSAFLHISVGDGDGVHVSDESLSPDGEHPPLPLLASKSMANLNEKLRKYVMLEVRGGARRLFHASGAEILRMVAEGAELEAREPSGPNLASVVTYRDLRQVLSEGRQVPSIRVRRGCIILCLPPVTALLLRNAVLMLVTEDLIIDQLVETLRELTLAPCFSDAPTDSSGPDPPEETPTEWPSNYPFEFAALEVLLTAAFQQLNADIHHFESRILTTKEHVQKRQTQARDLEALQDLKMPLERVGDRVTLFDKSFDALLDNADDLKRMELTKYHHNKKLHEIDRKEESPSADLEILLEYFDQEMELYMSRVKTLRMQIESIERMMSLRMSIIRNMLIRFDLAVSLIGLGTMFGTCISGIFGMNLE